MRLGTGAGICSTLQSGARPPIQRLDPEVFRPRRRLIGDIKHHSPLSVSLRASPSLPLYRTLRNMEIQYLTEPPPRCGQRLLPQLIDQIAKHDPDRALVSIPRGADVADGYMDVSFKTLATAIDRCAWWIDDNVGRSQELAPIFFIGPTDIRYLLILFAAAKTGHVVSRKIPALMPPSQLTVCL